MNIISFSASCVILAMISLFIWGTLAKSRAYDFGPGAHELLSDGQRRDYDKSLDTDLDAASSNKVVFGSRVTSSNGQSPFSRPFNKYPYGSPKFGASNYGSFGSSFGRHRHRNRYHNSGNNFYHRRTSRRFSYGG